LTAPCCIASADITLKIDVPVAGSFERSESGMRQSDINPRVTGAAVDRRLDAADAKP
jgi:hypothetical protein